LAASLIMAGVLGYLLRFVQWYWLVPVGAVVYFVVLWILKGVNRQDVADVLKSVTRNSYFL